MASTPFESIHNRITQHQRARWNGRVPTNPTETFQDISAVLDLMNALVGELVAEEHLRDKAPEPSDDFRCNNGHNFQAFEYRPYTSIQTPINPIHSAIFCTKCGEVRPLVSRQSFANKEK